MKFGQTTEDTFKATHPEAVNVGYNNELRGNIYKETPDNNKDKRSNIILKVPKMSLSCLIRIKIYPHCSYNLKTISLVLSVQF